MKACQNTECPCSISAGGGCVGSPMCPRYHAERVEASVSRKTEIAKQQYFTTANKGE